MRTWTARRSSRVVISLAVAAAACGVAAGCGDDDDKKSSAKPASFAMEATAEGKNKLALSVPATVKAGLVTMTLKNSDKGPRSAQIVRIVGDHNPDAVLKLVNSDEPTKIPDYIQDGGGVASVKPGETATVTQNLAPGKYIVWDDQGGDEGGGPGNYELGAKGEFTVTGKASDAELPSAPATLTTTDKGDKDYGFEFKGLKEGKNKVRFENTGEQLHHALLFPLRKGATVEELETFIKSDGKGEPPLDFENGVGTAVIDSDIAQNVELDLKAGNYAAVCFISDRDGEKKSHADKGMIEALEIK